MISFKKAKQINLLSKEGLETSSLGRILAWLLSTFRIIVIVTEIIVMVAFLSRFWLDAQNTDLTEQMQQKQAVIAASLDFEKEFKDTQKRLKVFSDLTFSNIYPSGILDVTTSYLPDDVFIESITFDRNNLEISTRSSSELSIQQFMVNLTSSGSFEEVILTEIKPDNEDVSLLIFKIKVVLKKIGKEI